jgi:hypothetical protein
MTERYASFSKDRIYRYRLALIWDREKPRINFLMLNPSTADEISNDPTVERCERRARMWGYGAVIITNIFAFRSTNPDGLKKTLDPIGTLNDKWIIQEACESQMVVCAWGNHGFLLNRGTRVKFMLMQQKVKPHFLRLAATGQPCHPLYLPYSLEPQPWPFIESV